MSAITKRRIARGAHARIAAEDERSGSKIGLFVLIIVFVALVAILLRLAEFSQRPARHHPIAPPPGLLLLPVP